MKPRYAVAAGMAALMIVMGIGRFAYTPILPFMQNDVHFSESAAGYLASFNYVGYLLGAVMATFLPLRKGKTFYLKIFLMLSIATTILMGLSTNFVFWSILRLASGVSSGIVQVLVSNLVLETLVIHKRQSWSGILFGGIGIGIFASGILSPILIRAFGWEGAWIGLGALSGVASIVSFLWIKENKAPHLSASATTTANDHKEKSDPFFKWVLLAYGLEGIGYVITGTFLVSIVKGMPQLQDYASLTWTFVGLAAIPSAIMWSLIAKKYGRVPTLYAAFIAQIIGVILPVLTHSIVGVFLSALLFGGTIMGLTSLFSSLGKSFSFRDSNKGIGYLTISLGIGQIVGPLVGGVLTSHSHSYNASLIFATATLVLGTILLAIGHLKQISRKKRLSLEQHDHVKFS